MWKNYKEQKQNNLPIFEPWESFVSRRKSEKGVTSKVTVYVKSQGAKEYSYCFFVEQEVGGALPRR